MKKTVAILLIAVMALTFAACSQKNKIVGTWTDGTHTWTFKKDGTGTFSEFGETFPMTYQIEGNKITVSFGFETDVYTYEIKGNMLMLTIPNWGDEPYFTLTKK